MKNFKTKLNKTKKKGAAMLVTTIVVVATALVIAISVEYLGLGEMIISLSDTQSEQALEIANSCVNEALFKIKSSSSYSGGSIAATTNSGTCTVTVTPASGSPRTISSIGTVGQTVRKITATVTVSGSTITITSWNEDIS